MEALDEGALCRKGNHWDLSDRGESLSRELPATPKQPLAGVVGPDRDGEERVKDVCFSVPVNPKECALCEPKYWGCLSREAAQKRVEPPPFQRSVERGVPSGPVRRKRADKALTKSTGRRQLPRTSATD